MQDVILRLVEVPMVRMFVLSGLIFLMIAVLGKIEGKIEPGRIGRIGSAVLGVVLILIGLIMQFGENHDIYAKLPPNMVATLPPQAAAAPPASAMATAETANIKVVSGTYGRNCNGKPGNASALVAKACDGHGSCDFMIDTSSLEDPAP